LHQSIVLQIENRCLRRARFELGSSGSRRTPAPGRVRPADSVGAEINTLATGNFGLVGGPVLRQDAEDEIAARRVREGADVGEELTLVPDRPRNISQIARKCSWYR